MANETSANVSIEGLDKVLRKLSRLGPAAIRPAIAEGATHIKSVMAEYPRQIIGRKQPPKTLRQRIFLINAIGDGTITVPYRRTGGLGRRWTIIFRDEGETAAIGNNSPGARFVHDPEDQSAFHAGGGWKTTETVATEESGDLRMIMQKHIHAWNRRKVK